MEDGCQVVTFFCS